MLSHLARRNSDRVNDLATELIALGNPWLVYRAMSEDNVKLSEPVAISCRWLVHPNWTLDFSYRDALDANEVSANSVTLDLARQNWKRFLQNVRTSQRIYCVLLPEMLRTWTHWMIWRKTICGPRAAKTWSLGAMRC